ncbi:hypothetical protein FGG08_001966 [Glutinoglossum americanum]|uniref:Semialdehyde dehydrogenase dimerisation domain-containing protein n=1 Tax=Glutinoglossum americanum TaxID=1670608 RepID=A0A9P8L4X1_9PEZI|nr:hypothetical protein FGG08_001966 [Glutinoglossum americanum]
MATAFPKKKCGKRVRDLSTNASSFCRLHPHFVLHAVGASSRSAGKKYRDAVRWKQAVQLPKGIAELVVKERRPEEFSGCDIIFSGLDSDIAGHTGEEDKIENEAQEILGSINEAPTAVTEQSALKISAACNRVPVLDGHTACVSLRVVKRPPPSTQKVKQALREYISEAWKLGCPSTSDNAIVALEEDDRPQPRLDRDTTRHHIIRTVISAAVIGAAGSV